jgi:Aspartyl protease
MSADVHLLVDSGADVTLLTESSVRSLGIDATAAPRYEVAGFDGGTRFLAAVELDLLFCGKAFRGRYLLTDSDMGVLGRDILNHLPILLNGPKLQWDEWKPA